MDEPTPEGGMQPRALAPRRQIMLVVRLSGAVALLAVAILILPRLFRGPEAAPPAPEPGTFRPTSEQMAGLNVQTVAEGRFHDEVEADGRIALADNLTTQVYSPYSGRVARLLVEPGDIVAKGAPLFAVEASEFVQADNDLVAAVAGVASATAQRNLAKANEQREHAVYEAKGGALKDWLQSRSDLVNAESARRTALIALASARSRLKILGQTDPEISALEAAPETGRMSPEALVPAPIAGIVIQRQVGIGQYITSAAAGASNPVLSIGDISKVWLVGETREADAPRLHVGQPVEVQALSYPGQVFRARLTFVDAVVDETTRRVAVRAEIENPGGSLKPGMWASFRIATSADRTLPEIPASAVVYEGDKAHVWVVRTDGLVAIREIRTGQAVDGRIAVLDGLKVGETIVTKGPLFIDRAAESG